MGDVISEMMNMMVMRVGVFIFLVSAEYDGLVNAFGLTLRID